MRSITGVARIGMVGLVLTCLTSSTIGGRQWALLLPSVAAQTTQPASTADPLTYQPLPQEASEGIRLIGSVSRAGGPKELVLVVLAPDHAGLTIREQPTLYWYLAQETKYPVEVTLIDAQSPTPLVETLLPSPLPPGLHRVRLADYDVRLVPEMLYEWSVALRVQRDRRSRDIITSGGIKRITPSAGLRDALAQASKTALPRLYAEASLWYDAIAILSDLIEAAPQERVLRQQRAALLRQVGLPEPAAYDLQNQ